MSLVSFEMMKHKQNLETIRVPAANYKQKVSVSVRIQHD